MGKTMLSNDEIAAQRAIAEHEAEGTGVKTADDPIWTPEPSSGKAVGLGALDAQFGDMMDPEAPPPEVVAAQELARAQATTASDLGEAIAATVPVPLTGDQAASVQELEAMLAEAKRQEEFEAARQTEAVAADQNPDGWHTSEDGTVVEGFKTEDVVYDFAKCISTDWNEIRRLSAIGYAIVGDMTMGPRHMLLFQMKLDG